MPTYEEVEPRLFSVLRKTFGPHIYISRESKLWDFYPDSTEILGLMLEMDNEFSCQLPWEEVKVGKVQTVDEAIKFFVEQLNKDKT